MTSRLKAAIIVAVVTMAVVGAAILAQRPETLESLIRAARNGDYAPLHRALESKRTRDRINAVKAISEVPTKESVSLLHNATRDKTIVVRVAIVQALPKLDQEDAFRIINDLLDDRENGIVRDAISELERLIGKNYDYESTRNEAEKVAVVLECKKDIADKVGQF